MPAGCEFICRNPGCVNHNNGFTMTAPWPMGRVELVLNAINVRKNPEFRKGLIRMKNEGHKHACITYPNIDQIEKTAYRVQLWSLKAQCLWQFDAEIQDNSDNLTDIIKKANLPVTCTKTGCDLWDFNKTIQNGILCPHCHTRLQQDRWFTNED